MPIKPENCAVESTPSAVEECCSVTFTGFCLSDGTPIGIVIEDGVQLGWINITTGLFTVGAPPAGAKICDSAAASGGLTNVELRASPVAVSGTVSVTEPVSVDDNGGSLTVDYAPGTLSNGVETAVSGTAVQVLAANSNRKTLFLQNVGSANSRVGIVGVTNTTGIRLVSSANLIFDSPHCPTNAIFAIRESSTDTIIFATEVT